MYSLPQNNLFNDSPGKSGDAGFVLLLHGRDGDPGRSYSARPHCFERFDDVVGIPWAPFSYYALSAPILNRCWTPGTQETCSLALAGGIGGPVGSSMPWKSYEEYLKFRIEGLAQSQKGAVADKPDVPIIKLSAGEPVQPNFSDGAELWKKLKAGSLLV